VVDRRYDPDRRHWRPAEWPAPDRAAWAAALRTGSILQGSGLGAKWAPATTRANAGAYGRFLNFLDRTRQLDTDADPAGRLQPHTIEAFLRQLQAQMTSSAVWSIVSHLYFAARAMWPHRDWRWLRQLVARLHRMAVPARSVINRIRPSRQLYHLGLRLMAENDEATSSCSTSLCPMLRASRYRDGLMLALQAARPLRLKNLASIELGRQLRRVSNGYLLCFDASEMKNRRPLEVSVPDDLVPWIDGYFNRYRPVLLQGTQTPLFWITNQGQPMKGFSVYHRISKLTNRHLGTAISPHLFRHALATSIAIDSPEQVRMATALLGHAHLSTTDRYYVMSGSLQASRAHGDLIASLRRTGRRGGTTSR